MSTVVISVFIIAVVLLVIFTVVGKVKNVNKPKKAKNRSVLMRDAEKKLAQNPHDPTALSLMGDIYYQEQDWEKAYSAYAVLVDHMSSFDVRSQNEAFLRCGICGIKTNRLKEAKKALLASYNIDSRNFEVNYNLGYIYFLEKEYEKAVTLFRRASLTQQDNYGVTKHLGYSYQKLKKYNDALPCLKKALDLKPDDKEILFAMGECLYELDLNDKALKVLLHFRADPVFGPQASLYTGMLRTKLNQLDKAAEDFKIGLKHVNIPIDVSKELRYRLAQTLLKAQVIGEALDLLKELQTISPGYKDVASLIMKYQELNQNKNLQAYLMAGQSDFVGLCRKIVGRFYAKARVKILDITASAAYADIVAEIDTPRYSDIVVFRFFRAQGSVGELLLREFHAKIREAKGGNGVCVTAGTFTEEAIRYTEGRPIDLYDKKKLSAILNSVR